jgi:DNA polymerase
MDPTAHQHVELNGGADLQGFRETLRIMTLCNVPPRQITWTARVGLERSGNRGQSAYGAAGRPIILPRYVVGMIELVVCHKDPEKYALLYDLVWRMQHDEKNPPFGKDGDELVLRLETMKQSVRADLRKMQECTRFLQIDDPIVGERFIAWFEPEHYVVERAGRHFVDRFGSLDWTILTPMGSLRWDRKELRIGPPAVLGEGRETDALEIAWRPHEESVFNPSRTNEQVMRQLMPDVYRQKVLEGQGVCDIVRNEPLRVERVEEVLETEAGMPTRQTPNADLAVTARQEPKTLTELNRIIRASKPFVEGSDKAVLGEGPLHAEIAFVGEQPVDQEDLQGKPFVGPAGKLLDRAMEAAGIERRKAYVTNAVKHFKFVQRGKRRLHQSPTAGEVKHYRWWLEKELDFVQPKLVVGLGATAVHALAGRATPIGKNRGPAIFGDRPGYITVHPSSILRQQDDNSRQREYAAFVNDLKRIRDLVD